uniref:ZF-HD dimerization-type domain-containing protein n=1 Tax=Salix viminalis TaxID=40686 RepID=A0A6N2MAJ0_SALVM
MDLSVVPYQQQQQQHKSEAVHDQDVDMVLQTKPITAMIASPRTTKDPYKNAVKYKECMRNHAASIGGHANDGCGEFMPRGDDGTRDSLTCAACGCHRNFHRRESGTKRQHQQLLLSPPPLQPQQFLLYGAPTTKNMNSVHDFISRPHDDDDDDDGLDDLDNDRRSETPERGEVNVVGSGGRGFMVKSTGGSSNKRFRTKFTQEQKERMLEFAEKIGWRIQKHDDMALNQFCNEIGIKRNVLKVWMHNNKNVHRRRDGVPPESARGPSSSSSAFSSTTACWSLYDHRSIE